jgi:hypothetical protein
MLSGVQPRTANQILSQRQLAAEVCRLAGRPAEWVSRVRLDAEGRWYEQVHMSDSYELWLISWLPGHTTGFHDHGGANGAFSVVWGTLDECVVPRSGALDGPGVPDDAGIPDGTGVLSGPVSVRTAGPGVVRSFGPHYIHDVRNTSKDSVAVSIHAYSPPLTAMTRYDLTPGGLVVAATETQDDW